MLIILIKMLSIHDIDFIGLYFTLIIDKLNITLI